VTRGSLFIYLCINAVEITVEITLRLQLRKSAEATRIVLVIVGL